MRAVLLLALAISLRATDEVPAWCMAGIAAVESSSYYDGNRIVYVNQRRGRNGEVGVWQALPKLLRQWKLSPSLYEQDSAYAERATRAILTSYYQRSGDWMVSVAMWHRPNDPHSERAKTYANRVRQAAGNL